jgi:hypothetical protein
MATDAHGSTLKMSKPLTFHFCYAFVATVSSVSCRNTLSDDSRMSKPDYH